MAQELVWKDFQKADGDSFIDTRLQAHHAVQWVTRLARAFIEARPDDSHSSLSWNGALQALVSEPLDNTGRFVGLCIADMNLIIVGKGGDREAFPLDGKTDQEAGAWIMEKFASSGPYGGVQDKLPYEIDAHKVQSGAAYAINADDAACLGIYYNNAAFLFENILRKKYSYIQPGSSTVQCWPHHFDIAIFVSLETGDAETARAIGVGMAPGDSNYPHPYFYMNPWPHLNKENLPELPAPGQWHVEGFVGAVATAARILEEANTLVDMRGYLCDTMDICLEQLKYS